MAKPLSKVERELNRALQAFLAESRVGRVSGDRWQQLRDNTLCCLSRGGSQTLNSAFHALERFRDCVSQDLWTEFVAKSQRELVRHGKNELLESVQTLFNIPDSSVIHRRELPVKRKNPTSSDVPPRNQKSRTEAAPSNECSAQHLCENVTFGDTFYLLKTKDIASQTHTIALDEIITAGAELSVVCNYKIDLPWMWNRAPGLQTSRKIIVVHGEGPNEEQEWNAFLSLQGATERVRFIRPQTPPYGTVHSKMFLLFFNTGCRVCIHTANMVECDWDHKTQGAYIRDFPRSESKMGTSSGASGCSRDDFQTQLMRYIRSSMSGSERDEVCEMLSRYDFSSAGVAFISSVPGAHKGAEKYCYGHARLRSLLELECIPNDAPNSVAVCQFSSLGSIQQRWLEEEFQTTLFSQRKSLRQSSNQNEEIKLVFPTVAQVHNSNEGMQAGASLPVTGKNLHRDHITSRLHKWNAHLSGRERAMPHIKTFLRYSALQPKLPFWVVLGSFNLSVAAWGRMQGRKKNRIEWDRLQVLSYEVGVLFSPRLACPPMHSVDSSIKFPLPSALDKEIWYRARQRNSIALHLCDFAVSPVKDRRGEREGTEVLLNVPLPYALPPDKYTQNDTPWTTEFCSMM